MSLERSPPPDAWQWPALIVWLVVCYGAAAAGGLLMAGNADSAWYEQLRKPSWNPPGWVFGPVWTVLYGTMAVAAWGVWREAGWDAKVPLTIFFIQLVLNVAWSGIFFGMQMPGWALVEIAALWLAVAATAVAFWIVRPWTGYLLIPYLLWLSYAVTLNAGIWWLNR